jgi:hypothetical protein
MVDLRRVKACLAFGFALLATAECYAAAITLANPSFESPDVFDGGVSGEVDGWGETGGAPLRGLYDPDNPFYAESSGNTVPLPGTATGFQVGMVRDALALLAQSAGPLMANTTYTLTVAVGDSLLGSATGWIQLINNGTILAENRDFTGANGTFVDCTASFTSGDSVSGELIVVLRSDGNEVHYDNVRLDATLVPEVSSSLVFLFGTIFLCSFRRFYDRRMCTAASTTQREHSEQGV